MQQWQQHHAHHALAFPSTPHPPHHHLLAASLFCSCSFYRLGYWLLCSFDLLDSRSCAYTTPMPYSSPPCTIIYTQPPPTINCLNHQPPKPRLLLLLLPRGTHTHLKQNGRVGRSPFGAAGAAVASERAASRGAPSLPKLSSCGLPTSPPTWRLPRLEGRNDVESAGGRGGGGKQGGPYFSCIVLAEPFGEPIRWTVTCHVPAEVVRLNGHQDPPGGGGELR